MHSGHCTLMPDNSFWNGVQGCAEKANASREETVTSTLITVYISNILVLLAVPKTGAQLDEIDRNQ